MPRRGLPCSGFPVISPPTLRYDLLFSYAGASLLVRGPNDGAVTLVSQLVLRGQEQSRTVRGFDESHSGILRSDAVAAMITRELAAVVLGSGAGKQE